MVRGERDQSKRERDQLEDEIQIADEAREQVEFELGTVQQELTRVMGKYEALLAEFDHLKLQLESRLALTSTDPVALALTSTDSVALA